MAVLMAPANAESDHLIDVERADPVEVAPSALVAEAEILRELREAVDYRTAMSAILRVISGSAFDLISVLLTVLTNAKTLCRADMAGLYRYQDGAYRFAVGDGLLPALRKDRAAAGDPSRAGHDRRLGGVGATHGANHRCQAPSWNENMKGFLDLAINSENIGRLCSRY
jgi:hypothetical protein